MPFKQQTAERSLWRLYVTVISSLYQKAIYSRSTFKKQQTAERSGPRVHKLICILSKSSWTWKINQGKKNTPLVYYCRSFFFSFFFSIFFCRCFLLQSRTNNKKSILWFINTRCLQISAQVKFKPNPLIANLPGILPSILDLHTTLVLIFVLCDLAGLGSANTPSGQNESLNKYL